jgi:hypothetical protein
MWSGRDTLGSINQAISRLHSEESSLDRALQSAMAEGERLRQERGRLMRELARVKLDEIAGGRLVSGLDAGERRAATLLDGRRARIARAAQGRDEAAARLPAAEAAQASAAEAVEQALARLDALRHDTEASLASDPACLAARDAVDASLTIAETARRKAEQNAEELALKKKPYDEDPLFQYLWQRGFGTASYAHSGLTRFLDRMVASFIGYTDVRANYHMLSEIPLRLAEHAEAREAAVAEARTRLAKLEAEALDRAGIADLERALTGARAHLAAQDAALDEARKALALADNQRDQLMSGAGDPAYIEALATIAAADAKDDLATLYAEARRTPTKADETIVARIEATDKQIASADSELQRLRETARGLAERRADVERTRERFQRSGYDHPNATFGNERVIAEVLGGILAGALKGSVLWDTLRGGYSNRPPRSRPDFGGGFPFPIPGPWNQDKDSGSVWGDGWRNPGSAGPWAPRKDDDDDDDDDRKRGGWGGSWGGGGRKGDDDDDNFSTGGRF